MNLEKDYELLANTIFPDIDKDIEYYEKLYPERNLKEGEKVTRFAPSPTGFLHIGSFMQALIDYMYAKNNNGIFYLRNEDTDKQREVNNAFNIVFNSLKYYNILPDEYEINDVTVGNYGPYTQSEREKIYHTFIKHLIKIGRAYPCFCTKDDLQNMREMQEKEKIRPGYYEKYAKCRNISPKEAIERIKNGEEYTIRFKSMGDYEKKFEFNDLAKGTVMLPENDQDAIIMKSTNPLPTYHFAHVVDDHLMRTTHVVRGEEWLSSVPLHLELFKAFNFKAPKYIHTPLILKKDGDIVRKISKRKDPEASMDYYIEKGYPVEAIVESVMTIINSNYEEWHTANPDKKFYDFTYSPKKMSSSGAFFDLEKLNNISKNIISHMTKEELYEKAIKWSEKYDNKLFEIINSNKEYFKNIINIEREIKKPRKDIANYSEILNNIWYMYDELFENINYNFEGYTKEQLKEILENYINIYDDKDEQDIWFNKIKDLTDKLGYCSNMKEYKENKEQYKGSVADVSNIIRIAITSKNMSPNLYDIMKLLGKERVIKRLENCIKGI